MWTTADWLHSQAFPVMYCVGVIIKWIAAKLKLRGTQGLHIEQ